ncbi:MAG TPA: MFS transporter [Acidimicrobiia bacterium]
MDGRREPLLTARFLLVVSAGLLYFTAIGMLLPVLPLYVENRLDGSAAAVGIAVGALFIGAVLLRPYAGRLGDRIGRRVLIIGGALVVAVTTAVSGAVAALPYLVGIRLLAGAGEAAFFVGAATMITDLAPVSRRGEALSYWSVSIYGGLAAGPALGEAVLGDDRYVVVFVVAAAVAAVAALLGTGTAEVERPPGPPPSGPLWNRAALLPGLVLFLGLAGLASFVAFVRLYADDIGMGGGETIFLLYGGLVLCVRIVGARLPDILGARRAGTGALVFTALGMGVMAAWRSPVGLLLGTAVFAAGMSLLYPALLVLALSAAPDGERASVVGTFSSFFDLSQGVGALMLGGVAELAGYRGSFAAAAGLAILGLVVLRGGIGRHAPLDPRHRAETAPA